jgi:hypothetical protein
MPCQSNEKRRSGALPFSKSRKERLNPNHGSDGPDSLASMLMGSMRCRARKSAQRNSGTNSNRTVTIFSSGAGIDCWPLSNTRFLSILQGLFSRFFEGSPTGALTAHWRAVTHQVRPVSYRERETDFSPDLLTHPSNTDELRKRMPIVWMSAVVETNITQRQSTIPGKRCCI